LASAERRLRADVAVACIPVGLSPITSEGEEMNDEQPGVAMVTGANRGIGLEVARQLAGRGYQVLLSARDGEKARAAAEELGGDAEGSVRAVTLDVADPASIEAVAKLVSDDPGRLDVLVNNAGVGTDFGVSGTSPDWDAMQRALDTNFYGAYRLTVALLGVLRESAHPRIVNVSSGMGGVAEMGGWSPGYRVSKAAMNAMTRILSTELKDEGFLVNSACPGFVNTDMGGPMGATKSVQDGAAGIVWLATLPDEGPTGGFFRDGSPIAF
jgi:NAD(P)-dependent dehydrogenase (short-subunit alcohol dehydrogenase family)